MKKLFFILLALISCTSLALAQSSPGFSYGQVPTAGEWNAAFAGKQDYLGFFPLNSAGGSLTGELYLASSSSVKSGLNMGSGFPPTRPAPGDVWMTSAGMFYSIGGTTVGPLGAGGGGGSASIIQSDYLVPTATNVLPPLTKSWNGGLMEVVVNGLGYFNFGASPAFTVAGTAITWSAANSGHTILTTDLVTAIYSTVGFVPPIVLGGGVAVAMQLSTNMAGGFVTTDGSANVNLPGSLYANSGSIHASSAVIAGSVSAASFSGSGAGLTGVASSLPLSGAGSGVNAALADSTMPASTAGEPVFVVTDTRWGTSTCAGPVACPIGTGGDDQAPLNAISAACATAKGCVVYFPPGTQPLNVCAASWTLPAVAPISMVIKGNGKAYGGVRILPGCATALNTVINVPGLTFGSPVVPSTVYYEIDSLRVDAYCLAPHDVYFNATTQALSGFNSSGSMYRNVVPSLTAASYDGGSNILIGDGYQNSIDASNSVENMNDVGHTCYGAYSAGSSANVVNFPPYLLDTTTTDSHYAIQGPGASIAGVVARYGGANRFTHAHPWGFPATNLDGQPFSSPQYDFIFRGAQILDTGIFDSGVTAGVRQQVVPASTGVDTITSVTNAGSGGTPGYVTLTGVSGTGTKWTALGVVGSNGSLVSIPWVMSAGNYSVSPSLTAETASSTGGLSGVVVHLQMGSGLNSQGSMVSGMFGCCATYDGVQLGAGVTSFRLAGNDFTGLSGTCVRLDAGATLPVSWNETSNAGCNFVPVHIAHV